MAGEDSDDIGVGGGLRGGGRLGQRSLLGACAREFGASPIIDAGRGARQRFSDRRGALNCLRRKQIGDVG